MVGRVAVVVAHRPGLVRGVVPDDGQAQRQVAQLLCQATLTAPDLGVVGGRRGAQLLCQASLPAAVSAAPAVGGRRVSSAQLIRASAGTLNVGSVGGRRGASTQPLRRTSFPAAAASAAPDGGRGQQQAAQLLSQASFPADSACAGNPDVGGRRGASAHILRQAACPPTEATGAACAADGVGAEGGRR